MQTPIRVVVVDDSAIMRRAITAMLARDPEITVVGEASDGREAITLVQRLRPDVVTMDVWMPVLDGLATTEQLMAFCPTPILVLTASLVGKDVDLTFKMLGAGALDVIEKPRGTDPQALARAADDLVRRVRLLARVRVVTHLRGRRRAAEDESRPLPRTGPLNLPVTTPRVEVPLVVIGASTGGPRVVYQILSELPPDLPAAVIVVQHIAVGFGSGMAEWLASTCAMPVQLARAGTLLAPAQVLVAPDGQDLSVTRQRTVRLANEPHTQSRPSVDVAMRSAAASGAPCVAVLLTGMGRDGAEGMLAVRRAGGYTIAQDEASCAIFGMPRAAIEAQAVDAVLAPTQIAHRIIERVARYVLAS